MKKKTSEILIYLIGAILSILVSWYILDSLWLAIAYCIAVMIGIMFLLKQNKKNLEFYHNIDASYEFVNLMNVQMLSTTNIYEAYQSIENYIDVEFSNISNEDLCNQLLEIANNYNLNAFKMYVNTIQIYDNDGGNYKNMQEIPTSLCQNTKVYYHKLKSSKFYKLIEITSLFMLWICILLFLKISIPDYYQSMMQNITYQIIMLCVLLVGSFFYYLTFMEYLKNKIRGL